MSPVIKQLTYQIQAQFAVFNAILLWVLGFFSVLRCLISFFNELLPRISFCVTPMPVLHRPK